MAKHQTQIISTANSPCSSQKASAMKFFNRRTARIGTISGLFAIIQLCTAVTAVGDPPATAEGKPLMTISEMAVGAPVTCCALAPAGDLVALGGDDGRIRFWNLTSGKVIRTITAYKEEQYIGCVAFSPKWKETGVSSRL
jgi:WD40 repeat protein